MWCSPYIWLLLLLVPAVSAQQVSPIPGKGLEPPGTTTVYVSTFVDRLMRIDGMNYEFQALLFLYLSWRDPRAKETVAANMANLAANSSASCRTQCHLHPQEQPNPVAGCCDDVWVPYLSFSTLVNLVPARVMRWGVNIEPTSDSVAYWSIVLGTFMATFDLRAFPFDVQHLHVQMEVPAWAGTNVQLQPSSSGTRMFSDRVGGDDLSGWRVKAVRMSTFNISLCERFTPSSSQPSARDDPAPLVSQLLFDSHHHSQRQHRLSSGTAQCAALLDKQRHDPSFLVYTKQNLDGSSHQQDHPHHVAGVTCTIVIERFHTKWVMSAMLPIVAATWLGFVIFLLPRDGVKDRLTLVLSTFLAVAAVQFLVAHELPSSSYMTALQQAIATGYIVLIVIAIESVLIWWLAIHHQARKRLEEQKAARRQFKVGVKSELHARSRSGRVSFRRHRMNVDNQSYNAATSHSAPGSTDPYPREDEDAAVKVASASSMYDAASKDRCAVVCQNTEQGALSDGSKNNTRIPLESTSAPTDAQGDAVLHVRTERAVAEAARGRATLARSFLLCSDMRLYFAALKQDETLADQLSWSLNKWLGILQFLSYNVAVLLIFVINWWLYCKS